jgi:FtsP/CotA-like multicopper oxidase with cupredoxin domain
MKKFWRLIIPIVTILALTGIPIFAAPMPVAAASSIVYNLYATDGWWPMADGTKIYSYGFIGGRSGEAFSYLNAAGALVAGTVPLNPTPGLATAAEALFAGNAQFPAPLITAAVGDTVEIRLKNLGVTNKGSPNDPHSIHLHALDVNAANDGVPETSVAAVPANSKLPGAGNVVVYMFTPTVAGTYFYHCHQEADIHVTMGMYGALIVYNAGEQGANSVNNPVVTRGGPGSSGNLFNFHYDKDYVMLLSDTDIRQHKSEQVGFVGGGAVFNPVDFKPQYWFINGLSFPNTVHATAVAGAGAFNFANWLTAHQGYDPLIAGKAGSGGQKVLVRMVNMGFETQPMHMHGFHAKVLGSDQRPWTWAQSPVTGLGLEKNTISIGSGEEYDLLYDFTTQAATSTYPGTDSSFKPAGSGNGTETRYNPVGNVPQSNTFNGPPPVGNPLYPAIPDPFAPPAVPPLTYIGGPVVTGAVGLPGTSQLFPFHNHDDYKATNNGVYPGGQFTMIVPLP